MPDICDGHSVGVLLRDTSRRLARTFLIDRPDHEGKAPVAGHVYDAHTSPESAARAELQEEIGLKLTGPLVTKLGGSGLWLPNRCYSPNPHASRGHTWFIYAVDYSDTTGEMAYAPGEVDGGAWYIENELGDLVAVTADWATGKLSDAAWKNDPGMEPPWCLIAHEMDWITLTPRQVAAIREVCATHPADRL